ncbi:hypothetical protein ig2599ANME_0509 [groundwater metagenome]
MEVKIVKDGILIPKNILKELGIENFEVLTRDHEILIRPKTNARRYYGFVGLTHINEKFLTLLETDWSERGEIESC